MSLCEYCEIFKDSFFIEDLFIIPFRNFYLMIDNWYFRYILYYYKTRPRNRKNFAIDRSKFIFRYLMISFLQRFVSSSNGKEKLVALNWTILVSNFRKYIWSRSSRSEVFCWKGVLKKFAKFIGKQLCRSLYFNKVAGLRHATWRLQLYLKKGSACRCFPVNFPKLLRAPIL